MSITVRVITPDRIVWDNVAEEVILPSSTGQLGILSGHAPLLTALNIGVMRIRPGKDWENIAVLGGFDEVSKGDDRRKTIQAQQSWRKARARYQAAGGLVSV